MSEDKKIEKSTNKGREQKSGHGSLTKAGKVRSQTPIILKTNIKKRSGPSKRNRKEFYLYLTKVKENASKPKTDYTPQRQKY